MTNWVVDERFGVICKNCKQYFAFSRSEMGVSGWPKVPVYSVREYGTTLTWDGIIYPTGDLEVIHATCGHCNHRDEYKQGIDITVPTDLLKHDRELAQKTDRLKALEAEVEGLRRELDEAKQTLKKKDEDIDKFATSYAKFADYFIMGKRGQGQEPDPNPLAG